MEEISNFCDGTGTKRASTRRPLAIFRSVAASHAPAREAFSGDERPPPASPDADQPPYLLGFPIRALHVPLLGIFVSVGPPNSLSGEAPATFSPPQSLHGPWEVFFYLSGGTTLDLRPSPFVGGATPQSEAPPSSSASQASIASVAQPGSFLLYTTTSTLPTVTLANGSQTVAKGIGLTLPLPSLPLTSVLYTPECPFNLISISKLTRTLNCSITFSDKFVTLQDRSTGKTIGIDVSLQGLYHLTSDSSAAVCISTDAPLLIHNRLGHPSLSKFQKMVPRFSTLSSLPCESCQLGKHTGVSFPSV
ncbi:hypothetical protein CK203_076889 [Vitis vinifera]|uniref:GAG-pre-integrase domain-containing protein n=1 Tax=Vitis vinifera TaxID=29760 RepID=A0A438ESW1_VITVI|nr:hypothetical protein CK203_076889 [Vitis vinifera]